MRIRFNFVILIFVASIEHENIFIYNENFQTYRKLHCDTSFGGKLQSGVVSLQQRAIKGQNSINKLQLPSTIITETCKSRI